MNFCGEVVKHKVFGKGKVIEFIGNNVTILFDESKQEKKFIYPTAFVTFLEAESKAFVMQIEEDNNAIFEMEVENNRINDEYKKQNRVIKHKVAANKHSMKISDVSDKNNIAFKCNYCDGGSCKEAIGYKGVCSDDTIKYNINVAKHIWCNQPENKCYKYLNGEISREEISEFYESTKTEFSKSVCYESQMFEIWIAGAGITHNGDKKGNPMLIKNATANSLAVLTTRLPNATDKDRFIFAVFLIDENYEGDKQDEGYVGANPIYRIQLSLDEAINLKFWDYYFNPNSPDKMIFGSGLHRYFTDVQSAQLLKKICEIKKGTSEEELSIEFLEYFCKTKKLDVQKIPLPNGALLRVMA